MASTDKKEKENFLRHAILVVDHCKSALISLIEFDLQLKHVTFEQFLNINQHEIFHMCYPKSRCCQCVRGQNISYQKVLNPFQIDLLFEKTNKLNVVHVNRVGANDFCCSTAKSSLTLDILDVSLARCLLFNLCFDVFWHYNLQHQNIEVFLNAEKHTIFHLWKYNTRCCHCPVVFNSSLNYPILNQTEWQSLYHVASPLPPCSMQAQENTSPCNSLCIYEAQQNISVSSLNHLLQQKILEHCCSLRQSVETLVNIRNFKYSHADSARISDSNFEENKNAMIKIILKIAKLCGKEPKVKKAIEATLTESLDHKLVDKYKELMSEIIYQNSILQQQQIDETNSRIDATNILVEETKTKVDEIVSTVDSSTKRIYDISSRVDETVTRGEKNNTRLVDKTVNLEKKISLLEKENTRLKDAIRDPVPSNIRDQNDRLLQSWQTTNKRFVETTCSKSIYEIILKNKNNSVLVVANSGIGKTVTIQHVALRMKEEHNFDVIPVTDPLDVVRYSSHDRKTLFVIDNFCGTYSLNEHKLNEWKDVKELLHVLIDNNNTKILMSCRLQVSQCDLFQSFCEIMENECNMVPVEFCLTLADKLRIAKRYLRCSVSQIRPFVRNFDCFPLLCFLYNKNPFLDLEQLFQSSFTVYKEEIDRLYKNGHYSKICALALCVMFNNRLSEDLFNRDIDKDRRHIIEETLEACKLNRGTSRLELLDECNTLQHTFFRKNNGVFSAIHDKIFHFMCFYFGQKSKLLRCLIKHASTDLINERFLLYSNEKCKNKFHILVPDTMYQIYIDRLIDDWSEGYVNNVLNNVNFLSEKFRQKLFKHIKGIDVGEQKKLAHTCDKDFGDSVLMSTCSKDKEEYFTWCLEHNVDINHYSNGQWSALHEACGLGNGKAVRTLLLHKAHIDHIQKDGASPLYIACQNGYAEIVKILLEQNANRELLTNNGESPLNAASRYGHTEVVKMLLVGNGDNKESNDDMSPVYIACHYGHVDTLNVLLEKYVDIDEFPEVVRTAIFVSALHGQTDIVKLLLINNVNVNDTLEIDPNIFYWKISNYDFNNFEHFPVLNGKPLIDITEIKCIPYLTCKGLTPLGAACLYGFTDIATLLIDNNADVNIGFIPPFIVPVQ